MLIKWHNLINFLNDSLGEDMAVFFRCISTGFCADDAANDNILGSIVGWKELCRREGRKPVPSEICNIYSEITGFTRHCVAKAT